MDIHYRCPRTSYSRHATHRPPANCPGIRHTLARSTIANSTPHTAEPHCRAIVPTCPKQHSTLPRLPPLPSQCESLAHTKFFSAEKSVTPEIPLPPRRRPSRSYAIGPPSRRSSPPPTHLCSPPRRAYNIIRKQPKSHNHARPCSSRICNPPV